MGEQIDLSDNWGETTLSNFEVFMMGEAFYTWIATSIRMGHSSPGMTLDYTVGANLGLSGVIMRDFVAWTSHRPELSEGCEERLRGLMDDADMEAEMSARANRAMAEVMAAARKAAA